jgi:hypothetical protein
MIAVVAELEASRRPGRSSGESDRRAALAALHLHLACQAGGPELGGGSVGEIVRVRMQWPRGSSLVRTPVEFDLQPVRGGTSHAEQAHLLRRSRERCFLEQWPKRCLHTGELAGVQGQAVGRRRRHGDPLGLEVVAAPDLGSRETRRVPRTGTPSRRWCCARLREADKGKVYKLGQPYDSEMPLFGSRRFSLQDSGDADGRAFRCEQDRLARRVPGYRDRPSGHAVRRISGTSGSRPERRATRANMRLLQRVHGRRRSATPTA